ncbi:hypothetical protein V1509DRAFT_631102 [Lipomyces kononenkoae]
MSAHQLSNAIELLDNSPGNSNNPVSLDSEDDVIMEPPSPRAAPSKILGESDFATEQRLLDGLGRLDDLYGQLLSLRIAGPKLIRTLAQIESSTAPSEVYANFATRAREILSQIDQFTTAYKNASDIFSYADKSRAANPDKIDRGTFKSLFQFDDDDELKEENNEGDDDDKVVKLS